MKLYRKTFLSLCIAVAVTGCGGGGKKNLTDGGTDGGGTVEKNSTVCLDANANAMCDAGETSEKVVTWDKTNNVETTLSGDVPLAYKGENGYIFTAPVGAKHIYAGSTMMNSELIYNQVIANKTKADVKTYVQAKFGGKPSKQNKADIAEAIKKNVKAHPSESRYAVIAAVMDKLLGGASVNSAGIKNISVTADEVKSADTPSLVKLDVSEKSSKNIDDKVAEQIAAGWVDAKDSGMGAITARNGKVVGGSHYHNGLSVIDVASGSIKLTSVSVVTDAGHGKDAASGVSENYLREVTLNSDASYVYVNIPPKSLSSTKGDPDTFGLYKAKIESDGSIKTTKTGTVIAIDETGSVRLADRVKSFSVSADDSNVVVLDSEDNLTVYDGNLANPGASIEVGDLGVGAYITSSTTVFSVTKNADDDTKFDINKWGISTLTGTDKITLDFEPQELRVNTEGTKLVAFNHGHDNKGTMTIALIDLSDNSVSSSSIKITSDTAAVSPDFTMLAAVGHEDGRMLLVNLTVPGFSVQHSYPLENASRDVAFVNNSQVAIFNGRNSIAVVDIKKTTGNVNLDTKMALALEGLNRSSMNGGGFFNAVIKDMILPSQYENINIAWSQTGLDGSIDVANGAVTRPGAAGVDATGKLKANTTVSFRDVNKTGDKEFDISVRKTPLALPVAKTIKSAEGGASYPAGNVDGNIFVAPVRFKNAGDQNVYGFSSVEVLSSGNLAIRTGTADAPKIYDANEDIVAVGINGSNVIGVSKALNDNGQARIFTVAMSATGVMDDAVLNSINITSGDPIHRATGFNHDQSIVAVMIKKLDETFITEIYSVNAAGDIAFVRTIAMAPGKEFGFHGPVAVNDDGTVVYQKESGNTGIHSSNAGGQHKFVALEETARVWYHNGRLFVNTYEGNVMSYNENLGSKKEFSTGTGGRMYGGAGRGNYFFLPVQRSTPELNGIYQLEIQSDGSLKEIALSNSPTDSDGPDRFTVSGDGDTLFYSYRVRKGDNKGRWFGVVKMP